MDGKRRSRRRFLALAGAGVGAVALGYAVLTLAGDQQPAAQMPEMTYGDKDMGDGILAAYASQAGSTAGVKDTLLMHLPVLFGMWKTGDHCDWNAIRARAAGLKPLLNA
ncbi:MAG: ubiquinol-cytochrome c reductase iron-sulfur subunit N-terminal domain-containing protein [Nitrososphaerales archaeon]